MDQLIDLSDYLNRPDRLRTHKEIADMVMEKIAELAEQDKEIMPLPLVIINPSSASGSTGETWPGVASDLRSEFGSFQTAFTKVRGDAATIASDAARKGVKLIIACGGDGTMSEVANGILSSGKDAELGILPSGTGGDFRRSLEIPAASRAAARVLREGRRVASTSGRISFVDHNGAEAMRYFVGVASCGMSTKVIQRVKAGGPDWLPANTPKWLGGRISFGASLLQTAMRTEATRLLVQLDDEHERHLLVTNLVHCQRALFRRRDEDRA